MLELIKSLFNRAYNNSFDFDCFIEMGFIPTNYKKVYQLEITHVKDGCIFCKVNKNDEEIVKISIIDLFMFKPFFDALFDSTKNHLEFVINMITYTKTQRVATSNEIENYLIEFFENN